MRSPSPTAARRALVGLAVVAGMYVLAQLVVFTLSRPLSWDEVVYLAQTAPGEVGMDWGPQRARGMAWLVAPVAVFHPSAEVVRGYLIAVSGLGLFLAFQPWLRVLGAVAAAGAFVFGLSWIGLYFGMEVFPNLPAAFATVATAGYLADFAMTARRRALLGMGVSVAVIALFRPPDSVWLAAGMFVAAAAVALFAQRRDDVGAGLAAGWRRVGAMAAALAAGGLAGWAPWLIEMGLRYGGPLQALAAARTESASGRPRNDLDQYLNLIEGPVRLLVTDPTLTYRALAGLVLVAAFVAVALVHPSRRSPAFVAAAGMASGLVPYLVLHTGVNLRYLLPAWGLGSITVAVGATVLVQTLTRAAGRRAAAVGGAVTVVVAGAWAGGNASVADRNADVALLGQASAYQVAAEVAEQVDEPCAFVSEYSYPQISWATACIGLELDVLGETGQCPLGTHSLSALAEQGYTVFALARSRLPDDLVVSEWAAQELDVPGYSRAWRMYRPNADQVAAGAVPRLPREGEAAGQCPPSRAPTADEIQPLRIGPRLPGDTTVRHLQRRRARADDVR